MKICMGCMGQIEENVRVCPHCGYDAAMVRQESYYLMPENIIGGKYIVGRVLNYSGYTVSYLGFDAEANRKVVIKEYLPSDFSTRAEGEKNVTIYSGDAVEKFEQGLINFLNEANRIQQLNKIEGIAKVYDCFSENDTGYVISEYIEGRTLKEILDSGKRFSPEEARGFISKILRGLCLVHPLDIIHCDISPDTIMITQSGEIKLLDFGATRYVTTENSKSLAIILKQGYAPEEQYRSQGVRGPWTDVYALGAVMYRMITGIVPQESVERMINDELKTPSHMGIVISESLENALMNALNVYQTERTQSAEMFLRELNSPVVKRMQVKERKRETGKIPLWAKGLVAGLFLLVMVGGLVLHFLRGYNVQTVHNNTELLKNYTGKTRKYVEEEINKINERNGWHIDCKFEEVFDITKPRGIVCSQQVSPSTDLSKYKDGKEKLTFEIYRDDKLYYREIIGLNAHELAQKLYNTGLKEKSDIFSPKPISNKHYFEFYFIKTKTDKINESKLKSNPKGEINVEEIKKIFYYASEFVYIEKVPDYVNNVKYINKLKRKKHRVNICIQEGDKEKPTPIKKDFLNNEKLGLIDYYYTFEKKYSRSEIFKQNVSHGDLFDEREMEGKALLKVIKDVLTYRGKSGQELKHEIEEKFGSTAKVRIKNGSSVGKVTKVVAIPKYFKKGEEVKINIFTEDSLSQKQRTSVPNGAKVPAPNSTFF